MAAPKVARRPLSSVSSKTQSVITTVALEVQSEGALHGTHGCPARHAKCPLPCPFELLGRYLIAIHSVCVQKPHFVSHRVRADPSRSILVPRR